MSGETDFEGRKALVTGGSRGIGRAVCLELARRGADVAFIYRSRDVEAEATASEIRALERRALALKADLAQSAAVGAAVDRAAAEFGRLDVLVPAAGAMVAWREAGELSTDEWDRYLAVDLSGA
ncbi:MAG TPA: SDR family NAD(P)-dependent oxidoreductase, partial [Stellaceae bacterium]|nr:SDR family NAD(P)-dependent oxidoreductase [Stellaceae bacterium]